MLSSLLSENGRLSAEQMTLLMQFTNLTPGDFAVVRDKMQFEDKENINHDIFIQSLSNEAQYKISSKKAIGFRQ